MIDAHVHLFAAASSRYPREVSPLFPEEREARVEDYLAVMADHGVSHAVVVALSSDDEYVIECLRRHGDRFVGILVDRSAGGDPLAGLDARFAAASELRGLRVRIIADDTCDDPRSSERFRLFTWLAERGLVLWFYSTPRQLELLEVVARELPSLPIVLNHLGFSPTGMTMSARGLPHADVELPPHTLAVVLRMAELSNVHVMVSGEYGFSHEDFPFADVTPVVRTVFDEFGPDRMMWASDYPLIACYPGYSSVSELPRRHLRDASETDLAKITGGTAARVLKITTSGQS